MKRILSAVLVLLVVGTGCTTAADPQSDQVDRRGPIAADGRPTALPEDLVLAALTQFDGCDDLAAHVKDAALDLVTPWGLESGG